MAVPQYHFAWVTSSDTTFLNAFKREDEKIFSFSLQHSEGQIPTLEIEVENPGVGLLNPARKQWAWFAYTDALGTTTPLLFGRLVAIAGDIQGRLVTLQIVSRANDYLSRKQLLAESLKVSPYYDPLGVDPSKRDDPDTILEGYSAAWHVDRTTLTWTISDILQGEDGTLAFGPTGVFYDSLQIRVGEAPLKAVKVSSNAAWSQNSAIPGVVIPVGVFATQTYSDQILQDWPKPGASLGGGWEVAESFCVDTVGIANARTISSSYSWQNKDTTHQEGDTMSMSESFTGLSKPPKARAFLKEYQISEQSNPAIIGDGWTDTQGSVQRTWIDVGRLNILAYLAIRRQSSSGRARNEDISLLVTADTQDMLIDADAEQEPERIDVSVGDVSATQVTYLNWASVAGTAVSLGQVILTPDGGSYQICVDDGTCGVVAPTFSDIRGVSTVDGGVVWACVGSSLPSVGSWAANTVYLLGSVVAAPGVIATTYRALVPPLSYGRTTGVPVAEGTVIKATNGSYQVCVTAGTTALWLGGEPAFSTTPGAQTTDGTVVWQSYGLYPPTGTVQLVTTAGTSGAFAPPFSSTPGTATADGTVTWKSLGSSGGSFEAPLADFYGDSFFPTDRGAQFINYLVMLARAKLLTRARAIEISFEVAFEDGLALSCRKNVTITDDATSPRIPGGTATGKIIKYELYGAGDGKFGARITIGCAVGKIAGEIVVTGSEGTPTYVDTGYTGDGYQQETGATVVVGNSVAYPPINYAPDAGAITELVSPEQVVLWAGFVGSVAAQQAAIEEAIRDVRILNEQREAGLDKIVNRYTDAESRLNSCIEPYPIYFDLGLRSIDSQSSTVAYSIETVAIDVPMQIDLSA